MSTKKLLQAASGAASGESVYVDDVFSTHLYEGTGSAKTITTGIDMSGEGGMVWFKSRSSASWNFINDTERGATKSISTNSSNVENTYSQHVTQFNSDGYNIGTDNDINLSGGDFVNWSFRKQAGFFDVVTYTGDGTSSRDIAHNLGSKPGFIVTKRTNLAGNWTCYHQALGYEERIYLDLTNQKSNNPVTWVQEPTATHFTVGSENTNGDTYVAYIFAHDDQRFGDNSDEAIIKCGSFTDGQGQIDVGFEPQFIIYKPYTQNFRWVMVDNMRGLDGVNTTRELNPNTSDAESDGHSITINATGFYNDSMGAGYPFIYIAIRRPMKTPTVGTEVFSSNAYTGNSTANRILTSSNNPVDLGIVKQTVQGGDWHWTDRLRGAGQTLYSNYTQAESTDSTYISGLDVQSGIEIGSANAVNDSGDTYISYMLSRATGFFDVVCFDGVNGATAFDHGLTVVPEMMIVKKRSATSDWTVYHTGYPTPTTNQGALNLTGGSYANASFPTIPTSTQFTFNAYGTGTQVAYLFATVAGVSKVGSVVHSGTTNVDCGFSAGARFVMAKRTDHTGDWFVWDSASGIVAGNDPYVRFNLSQPYVSSSDFIDPLSSGFTLTSSFTAGTYIFLAIA